MKRRDGKGTTSTDLLVCFPTRAHLTLMPKTICSPSRPSGPNKNSHSHQQYGHQVHHLRKSSRGGSSGRGGGGGHASPYLWSKTKQVGSDYSEPTSPKVTCAGQIKVRPRPGCKNWQSVMEEIERLHNNKQKKKPTWVESLGFKKEIMQFLTCLRSVKLDFQCFGSLPNASITSDDDEDDQDEDEDEDEDDQENQQKLNDQEDPSRAVFSKWFMVLQEDQNPRSRKEESSKDVREIVKPIDDPPDLPCAPPPNALFLMRCRSAPAKSWQEEQEEEEEEEENDDDSDHEEAEKKKPEEELQVLVMEEEEMEMEKGKKKKRESLEELMRYETDFYKFSCDIAKETWVVGGIKDVLSRSRSSKR